MTKYFASKTTTTSSLPVVFGHDMSQEQLRLVLEQGKKQSCHSSSQQERQRRQKFVEAYNEIVVENYTMIRMVQRFLILGPLAGLALIVRGMEMHTQHQSHHPQRPCATLFFGPLIVLVSTLTSVAAVLFLRQQLVEQLQDLCQQQQKQPQQQKQVSSNNPDDNFHDWNVTLESNEKDKHTLVFAMATTTMATQGETLQLLQAYIGAPLVTRDADSDSRSHARIAMV